MKNLPTIGQMRDRAAVQARTITRTATGPTETWATSETRWCLLRAIPTGKIAFLGTDYKNATHELWFRGIQSYTLEGHRFLINSKYYYIEKPAYQTDSGQSKFTKFVVREDIS